MILTLTSFPAWWSPPPTPLGPSPGPLPPAPDEGREPVLLVGLRWAFWKWQKKEKYWRKRMQPAHWHVTPNASSHHHHRARSWHHVPIPLNNEHLTRRAKTYRTWRSLSAPPLGQEPHCIHKFCYLKISFEDFALFILSNICSRSYQCIVCRTEGSNSSLD